MKFSGKMKIKEAGFTVMDDFALKSNKKPLITVVTVCFNGMPFIEQCIKSVISQDFCGFEYVVVDGNSTDGTAEVIKKHQESLAYWHSKPDRGLAHAFNLGVDMAKGDWILFLNSDDYFEADSVLSDMAPYLKQFNDKDVVFGKIVMVSRDIAPLPISRAEGGDFRWSKFKFSDTIPHQAAFTSRKYFDRVGAFNEKYNIAVDYEHYLRGGDRLVAKFVPVLVSNMRDGGMGKELVVDSLREWCRAQIETNSVSPFIAKCLFRFRLVKLIVKKAMVFFGWRKENGI